MLLPWYGVCKWKCYRGDYATAQDYVLCRMSIDERRTYLSIMSTRYPRADKAERILLLNEMAVVTDLHRESLRACLEILAT